MKSIRLAAALVGAFSLGGCYPAHHEAYAPAGLSRAAQFETMYGRVMPVSIRPARQSAITTGTRNARAQDDVLIYSKEWQRREGDREAKLKQSGTVCRC
jgi:hypothetical protein